MKGKLLAICTLVALAALCFVVAAAAHTPQPQVGICHATSGQHPFNSQTVNANSTAGGHDAHGDDIIPVYNYDVKQHRHFWSGHHDWQDGSCHGTGWNCEERTVVRAYPGKNLTTLYGDGGYATGAEVLANGCVIPDPPYTPCDETTGPVASATTWGGWVDNGDGTFTRTGSYTNTWYDARDPQHVCSVVPVPVSETLQGSTLVQATADCEGWSATLYIFNPDQVQVGQDGASGVWYDIYALEQAQAFGEVILEPERCLQQHGVETGFGADCQGASGWYSLDGGEQVVYDSPLWVDPYVLEQTYLTPFDIELPWGGTYHINAIGVAEPEQCLVPCALTPLYHMFVLRDFDAPDGYLQGGTCYVISNTIPSVERQAAICSYPFCGAGWTYRADSIPYGGYVYRDCHGNIVYGWSAWDDSWLRRDFNMWGRDPNSPRLPCCEGTGMGDLTAPSE